MGLLSRLHGVRRGDYTGYTPQEDPGQDVTWWPGEANVRVPVGVSPQQSPEPGEQGGAHGEIPARLAQIQVVTFRHDPQPMGAESFVAGWRDLTHTAAIPRGRMTPFGARANIGRPPAVAYGSLFQATSGAYPYAYGGS